MNKEEFITLMPKLVVSKEQMEERINQEKETVKNGKMFVSQLSFNRFLYKNLNEFSFEERLNLFSTLSDLSIIIDENQLYPFGCDIESFSYILKDTFQLDNMYELDNLYIKKLLKGKNITEEKVEINGNKIAFGSLLEQFVLNTFGMSMGDTPTVMLMLVVKKALLGSYLAELNVKTLLNGELEIYNISVLE